MAFLNNVWSAKLIDELEKESVYKGLANNNYTADAANVSTVYLGADNADVTVGTYNGNDISAAQKRSPNTDTLLSLSEKKYFNVSVDDVEQAQTKPAIMASAMRKSSIAIAQTMDDFGANKLLSAISSSNIVSGGIADADDVSTKGDKLLGLMTELKQSLRVANIAKTTVPWAVFTPEMMKILEDKLIRDDKSVFLPATAEQTLRSGFVGTLLGIDVFWSNNAPSKSNKKVAICGTRDAWTWADQVQKVETYRPERKFADAVKGLYVYGAVVTDSSQVFGLTL